MISKFKINEFSNEFKECVRINSSFIRYIGKECTGGDWEDIVAEGMKAERLNSNECISDIYNDVTAWSAKTVKNANPSSVQRVNLISGRISLVYTYGTDDVYKSDPNMLGSQIIEEWNKRVFYAAEKFKDIRTIVLIRKPDMSSVSFYEELTEPYSIDEYTWSFNENKVLTGYKKGTSDKKFTWQPSGSQFTIVSNVPYKRVNISLQDLGKMTIEKRRKFMEELGYKNGDFDSEIVHGEFSFM